MIIRTILLSGLLLPVVTMASAAELSEEALAGFELGLSVGVDAVEREYRVQGWQREEVDVLDFMVVLDSKSISTKRLLLLKDFGFRRGLSPVELSNGVLLYKSFDNRPDAEELVKYLNGSELRDIKEKVYVYMKRPGEKFTKAPFAFKYIFDRMQKEIKDDVKVVVLSPEQAKKIGVVKEVPMPQAPTVPAKSIVQEPVKPAEVQKVEQPAPIVVPEVKVTAVPNTVVAEPKKTKAKAATPSAKKTVIKAPSVKPRPSKAFRLKSGSVEYFSYNAGWGASDDFANKTYENRNFKAKEIIQNRGQIYRASGVVVTDAGIKYVKVVGKNMYFDAYNTSLGD